MHRVVRAKALTLASVLALPLLFPPSASAWVNCNTWTDGQATGGASCSGTGHWRVAVYCDWPSVSPVYSQDMSGSGQTAATCWFQKHAQRAAVEQW